MKTIQLSLDLRSFFLGSLTVIGLMLLFNFKPSEPNQPEPGVVDNRRFQAVTSPKESIILDTRTGQFVVLPSYVGQPRRLKYDFADIDPKGK